MDSRELKERVQAGGIRRERKRQRQEERFARRIDRKNRTPSRVAILEVDGGVRMTIEPPLFRRYFGAFTMQGFWAVFFITLPFVLVGGLLLASKMQKFIPDATASALVTLLLLADVPLILFTILVKLLRSSFHLQVMDGNYVILRGRGMRFKSAGDIKDTSWRFKHARNGWVRFEWRTPGRWWGFEYLNYDDVEKVRKFANKNLGR